MIALLARAPAAPSSANRPGAAMRPGLPARAPLLAGGDLSADLRLRISSVAGDLYLVDRRSMHVRRLTHTQDGEGQPLFGSDGESILFQRDRNLFRLTIESGELTVVGVNAYQETVESPLAHGGSDAILKVDTSAEREQIESLEAFRKRRNEGESTRALRQLEDVVKNGGNIMPPSIEAAKAGVTTGEWSQVLREIFGEYRAPTGVGAASVSNAANT
ncbi:MAG: hypothetical protein IH924_03440, partial [Proteobacteria bacterium]|nr:hypothetical protein [Pseudomonadota bacterium]